MTDKPEMILKELYDDMTQAYLNTCKELGDMRIRAEAAEQERDKLLQALRNIVAVPVAKSMHNEALVLHNIAHKALEGSQPDGE